MATFIVGSDPHARPSVLPVVLKGIRYASELAEQRKADAVLWAGDLFHERTNIHSATYLSVYDTIMDGFKPTYIVVGNHDQPYKNTSQSILKPYSTDGLHIIEEPVSVVVGGINLYFLPYGTIAPWEDALPTPSILVAHAALKGAKVGPEDWELIRGTPLSAFPNATLRLFGHHHKRQALTKNSHVVGAMFPVSFGESWEDKGLLVVDMDKKTGKYSLEPVEIPGVPKYIDFHLDSQEDLKKVESQFPGNCVKVTAPFNISAAKKEEYSEQAYGGAFSWMWLKQERQRNDYIKVSPSTFSVEAVVREYLQRYVPDPAHLQVALDMFKRVLQVNPSSPIKPGVIQPISVHMVDFGPHVDTEINLAERDLLLVLGAVLPKGQSADGVALETLISSSNGAGKSWILQAIYWALTGHLLGKSKRRKGSLIRDGAKCASVDLVLKVRGQDVRILRKHPLSLEIWVDGEEQKVQMDLDKHLQENILGVPEDVLMHIILLGQRYDRLRYYLDLEDTEQRALVDYILGMSKLKPWVDTAGNFLSDASDSLAKAESKQFHLSSVVDAVCADLEPALADFDAWAEQVDAEIKAWENAEQNRQARIHGLKVSVDTAEAQIITAIQDLEAARTALSEAFAQREDALGALEEWETTYRDSLKESGELAGEIRRHEASIARLEKFAGTTGDAPVCGSCEQAIPPAHAKKAAKAHAKDLKTQQSRLSVVQGVLKDAQKNIGEINEFLGTFPGLESSVVRAESALKTATAEVESRRRELAAVQSEKVPERPGTTENPHQKRVDDLVSRLEAARAEEDSHKEYVDRVRIHKAGLSALMEALGYRTGRGVRIHVYAALQDSINEILYETSMAMSGGAYALQLHLCEQLKSGEVKEKFNWVVLFPDGTIVPVDDASGGQRQRLNLSIPFTFRRIYSDVCGVRCTFLGVDEVFDGLDPSGKAAVAAFLRGLSETVDNTMVITHDPSLQDLFEHRVVCLSSGGRRTTFHSWE